MKNKSSWKILKSTGQDLKKSWKELLAFELFYKLLVILIFKPLIGLTINLSSRLAGYSVLLNKDIFNFLMSLWGALALLIILSISVFVVYYEFSVILILLSQARRGSKPDLVLAMKAGLVPLGRVYTRGFLGLSLYILALIPLVNIGLKSSLLPEINIPNFITGEIEKYPGGALALVLGAIFLLYLFSKLFLVLPIMVFEAKNFKYARAKSKSLTKKNRLRLGGLTILLSFLWLNILYIPIGFIDSFSSSLARFIRPFTELSLFVFSLLVSPLTLSLIFTSYMEYNEYLSIDELYKSSIDRYLYRVVEGLEAVKLKLSSFFKGLALRIRRSKLAQAGLVLLLGIFFLSSFLLLRGRENYRGSLIIGHRGSLYGVENTSQAILNAAKAGAEYAEIDILLSKDGHPMVIHDNNLLRLTGMKKKVSNMTRQELEKTTVRSRGFKGQIEGLDQVYLKTKGQIGLLIELKTHGQEEKSVVDQTMKVLKELDRSDDLIFQTGQYELLLEMREKYPEEELGYIVIGKVGSLTVKKLKNIPCDFLVFEESIINRKLVRRCHLADKKVFVWTVNDFNTTMELVDINVDGIITDHPRLMRKTLDSMKKAPL